MNVGNIETENCQRKIIHIDMDAFYAAVEQRDNPIYQGQPVIVGGLPEQRGVVAACSYEARKFGIHSAMSAAMAYKLCPHGIFLKPRFDTYRQVSSEIQSIFRGFTELVESLSLDEAYLDVTDNTNFSGSATLTAQEIKKRIKDMTRLNASAGVSYNKFLAKIASDMNKPDGLYVIKPEEGADFIKTLPIRKFHGIGGATEKKMNAMGVYTGEDLRQKGMDELVDRFGKAGRFYYSIARGIDWRPVAGNRIRKSIGKEKTFSEDKIDIDELLSILQGLSNQVARLLFDKQLMAQTITLKVKYDDFELITRDHTLEKPTQSAANIFTAAKGLLPKTEVGVRKVRLLGVTSSKLQQKGQYSGNKKGQINLL